MIKIENNKIDLPYIFGNIEISEFLKLKDIIDSSEFNFNKIKNFIILNQRDGILKQKMVN